MKAVMAFIGVVSVVNVATNLLMALLDQPVLQYTHGFNIYSGLLVVGVIWFCDNFRGKSEEGGQ